MQNIGSRERNERTPSNKEKSVSSHEKEGQTENVSLSPQQGFILMWSEWTNGFHDDIISSAKYRVHGSVKILSSV